MTSIKMLLSDRKENAKANESTVDQELTVGNSYSNPAANENFVNVKTLEGSFNEIIGTVMSNIVDC